MEKEPELKEKSESDVEGNKAEGTEETMESTENTVVEDKPEGEDGSKDEFTEAAVETKPEAASDTDMKETSANETVMETVEENEGAKAPEAGTNETPAGEKTNPSSSDGKEAAREMPELPKVKLNA